jgi:hypothetical protein
MIHGLIPPDNDGIFQAEKRREKMSCKMGVRQEALSCNYSWYVKNPAEWKHSWTKLFLLYLFYFIYVQFCNDIIRYY